MQVTQDIKKEILNFLEEKIDSDEMWAEAFSKLITLDEADQNGAVWDMLESIKDSKRWDELFEEHPEALDLIFDKSGKSIGDERTISLDEFLALTPEDNYQLPDEGQGFHA